MKLSQRVASKSRRILLYGPPKSGKTWLAGNLAQEYNLLWFDLENGVDTLLRLPPEQQEKVEVIAIPDTRSFPIAIETCLKAIKGTAIKICEKHGKVSCAICAKDSSANQTEIELNALGLDTIVVFDSLTQLTNSAIAHITKGQADDYKMQHDDWGNLGKLMDIFLSHVQNAPFHIVCITHENEVEMVDGKDKIVPTAGTRNFSRNVAKYFDEVYYLQVKNGKHIVGSSTTYANNILTGSRGGHVLEKEGEASLIPVFKGEVKLSSPATSSGSPGAVALSALEKLKKGIK